MRIGIAAMQAVASMRRGAIQRGFWIFNSNEVDQLKSQLSKCKTPIATAKIHMSLAKLHQKRNEVSEALPHAQASFSLLSSTPMSDTADLPLAYAASKMLMDVMMLANRWNEMLELAILCEKQARSLFSKGDVKLAYSLYPVACVLKVNEKLKEALSLFEEIFDVLMQANDPDVLTLVLQNLNLLHVAIKQPKEALSALSGILESLESSNFSYLKGFTHLERAELFYMQKDFVNAAEDGETALAYLLKHNPKEHIHISYCYHILHAVNSYSDKSETAKKYITAKVKFDEEAFPRNPQLRVDNMMKLGFAEFETGDMNNAKLTLETAISISSDITEEYTQALALLSRACGVMKDWRSASKYADRLKSYYSVVPARLLPSLCVENGEYKWKLGELAAAVALFNQAIELEAAHPTFITGISQVNIGLIHKQNGDITAALRITRHVLALFEHLKVKKSLKVANALDNLGLMEMDGQMLEAAERTLKMSLAWKEELGYSDSAKSTRGILYSVLITANKSAEAQTLLERARDPSHGPLKSK